MIPGLELGIGETQARAVLRDREDRITDFALLVLEGDGRVQEFVGGWSDWKSWRDARDAANRRESSERRESSRPAAPVGEAAPAKRRKLSFNEQREFDSLPQRIEEMEARKLDLERCVTDPAFYSRPQGELRDTLAALQALSTEIEAAYDRWAELEARR